MRDPCPPVSRIGRTPQNWWGPGAVSAEPPSLWHQPACKPGSVGRAAVSRTRDGHSSGTPVAWRLGQPTRTAGSGHRSRKSPPACAGSGSAPSLFGLAPGGVCHAACVAAAAVRSYRTVSPLPSPRSQNVGWGRRSRLCGTFPRLAPAGRYPAPYVHGARTFLPGHLSVLAGAAVQPTDRGVNGRRGCPRQGLCMAGMERTLSKRSGAPGFTIRAGREGR